MVGKTGLEKQAGQAILFKKKTTIVPKNSL